MKVRQNAVRLAVWLLALAPALWLLTHPVPLACLVPFAREPTAPGYIQSSTWPIIFWCLGPSLLAWRDWRWRQPVTFGWIAILFCLWQAYCYNTATHPAGSPFVIWGLLPGSDSQTYFNNAVEIAEGTGIRIAWGARQMWPGFLAVLHACSKGDLKTMLSFLTLIQAAVSYLSWEMIYRLLGRTAVFFWLCCVTLYYRSYVIGLFMTEQLGLALGILAAAILLFGWKRRAFIPWLIGLSLLSFALNARPGCYFVLAFLLLGAFWRFRGIITTSHVEGKHYQNLAWRKGLISLGVVVVCFLCNTIAFFHLVNPPRVPSNYWLVLYGIAKGGTWAQSIYDFNPGVTFSQIPPTYDEKTDRTFFADVKKATIKEILDKPIMLLYGAWRAWVHVTTKQTFFYKWGFGWWGHGLLIVSAAMLLLYCARSKIWEDGAFYWLVWIGVFFSLAFIPPWDSGDRTYAATDPLLWLTPAAFFSLCERVLATRKTNKESNTAAIKELTHSREQLAIVFRMSAIAGALLVITSLLLPSTLLELNRRRDIPRYSDLVPLETASAGSDEIPRSLVSLNRGIIVGARGTRTFVPYVAREDFDRGVPGGRQFPIGEFMKALPANSFVALLERPRYLCCDLSSFLVEPVTAGIPLEGSNWMSYKYILALATSIKLTEKQVMILCPSMASHETFWKQPQKR